MIVHTKLDLEFRFQPQAAGLLPVRLGSSGSTDQPSPARATPRLSPGPAKRFPKWLTEIMIMTVASNLKTRRWPAGAQPGEQCPPSLTGRFNGKLKFKLLLVLVFSHALALQANLSQRLMLVRADRCSTGVSGPALCNSSHVKIHDNLQSYVHHAAEAGSNWVTCTVPGFWASESSLSSFGRRALFRAVALDHDDTTGDWQLKI